MSNRPAQHRIASLAVASVRREWNARGHAVDEIKEDYGEDLLVQTCLNGRIDPSRIWVQVKGTGQDCLTKQRALPSVRVKAEQILRWARSADLVIAVLWDVNNDCGWYAYPQGYFNHFDLRDRLGDNVTLKFSREQTFNRSSIDRLAWQARIEHASRSLQFARRNWEESREMEIESDAHFQAGVYYTLLFDFAKAIEVAGPQGGFNRDFQDLTLEMVYERLYGFGSDGTKSRKSRENIKRATEEALIAAIFETINRNCAGNGAPLGLVKEFMAYAYPAIFTEEVIDVFERADLLRAQRGSETTSEPDHQ